MTASAGLHPTAQIDAGARLGDGTTVGAFSVIGRDVTVGPGCEIGPHAVVEGPTVMGARCRVFPFACIGMAPQDLKYRGEKTRLEVGSRNVFRESCTINRGTVGGGGVTTIGDDNLFMAGAHVAHDSIIGNGTIFANAATLAGHVTVGDHSTIGAFSGVHQYCRIGEHAFIGGYSVITQDALPYALTVGNRAVSHGINVIGLRRRNFSDESIAALRRAYRMLFRSKMPLREAIERVEQEMGAIAEVASFLAFIRSSERGVIR